MKKQVGGGGWGRSNGQSAWWQLGSRCAGATTGSGSFRTSIVECAQMHPLHTPISPLTPRLPAGRGIHR